MTIAAPARPRAGLAPWLVAGAVVAAAALVVATRLGEDRTDLWPAHDTYAEFLPNVLYALRSLGDGGRGLLWNPYQNSGEPFFGMSDTGLLYPANLLFLVLPVSLALRGVLLVNLVVAGTGMYVLGRRLGVGRPAALVGALAFELGPTVLDLTVWTPMICGPYVWLPAALACVERLVRVPDVRGTIALGAVLALALLPGYPQVVLITCQLIGARVAWELLTRPASRRAATILAVAAGMTLPLLLAAVQMVPAAEVMRASLRGRALDPGEIALGGSLTWKALREQFGARSSGSPLAVVPCLVASLAFFGRRRRRVVFYGAAAILFAVLAFGAATPLFGVYAALPFGALFRGPVRLLWVTGFCLAVLVAFGVDAVLAGRARVGALVVGAGVVVGLHLLGPGGLRPAEWGLAAAVLAGVGAGWTEAIGLRAQRWIVGAAVVAALVVVAPVPVQRLMHGDGDYFRHADTFAALSRRMTSQDRLHVFARNAISGETALIERTPMLMGVRAIDSYQPETLAHYAEYLVMLWRGRPLQSLNDYLVRQAPRFNDRLFELMATRYLVVDRRDERRVPTYQAPPLEPRAIEGSLAGPLAVFGVPSALPRARWVPRVAVVPDPQALLARLAAAADDPRELALVEVPPPSGFLGTDGGTADARTAVTFALDDPEHVRLEVTAPARGFLLLADTAFPGWEARVNDTPAPILRANHTFRLVEVPAGTSVVELRYRPGTLPIGAAISTVTLIAVALALFWCRRRPDGGASGTLATSRVGDARTGHV